MFARNLVSVFNSKFLSKQMTKQSSLQFLRTIFVNIEETPNPATVKFIPDPQTTILPPEFGSTLSITDRKIAKKSPLGLKLLGIEGVQSAMLGKDYITVTKNDQVEWDILNPSVFATILDFLSQTKEPIVYPDGKLPFDPNDILPNDSETVCLIKELIETRIRPRIQQDGGDIFYNHFDDKTGIVKIEMTGACKGCPSSSVTLKQGVEKMLKHYIPEVQEVIAIETEHEEETDKKFREEFETELQKVLKEEARKKKRAEEEKEKENKD
ncbi:hypothetical protein WA158_000233 [Blastocystis sp. Blastoise]